MSTKTENTKFIMCNALSQIRKAKKHPRLLEIFESAMEAHLEALRQEHGDTLENLDRANRMIEVYSEAFDGQKVRTHNALCESRRLSDDLWETRRELASEQSDREEGHDKLQEATAKLACQTQTIITLHRIIKRQENAYARLQGLLEKSESDRKREQAQAHREIMQAEAISDERYELLESKQKVVVSQRKRIEELEIRLDSIENQRIKRGFRWFIWGNKPQSKPLPKKTN